tara:strand:- start:1069 stop:2721 length:1653 start_codon:yes stop_codon:yes gene_type:complete
LIKELSISNFAIIDTLKVSFATGMTSVTGETGAGKSIIIGALSLVLGKRADLSYLKDSTKKCIIEASFDISLYNLKHIFDSEDIDYDKETILRRELIPSGKSRAFVNDTPVNLDVLNKISSNLIDIHSQNETKLLFSNHFQFKFLDSLSNNIDNMKDFKIKFLEYNLLIVKYKNLLKRKEVGSKELDYQNFLYNELNALNLETDSLSKIESQVAELSNITEIENKLSSSIELINLDEGGILSKLSDILNNIKSIKGFSGKFKDYDYRIDLIYTELRDILNDFESHFNSLESNPELLNERNLELNIFYSILKKHNVSTVDELIVIKNNLSKVFFDTNSLSKEIKKIKEIIYIGKESLSALSDKIHKNRVKAIPEVENKLKSLVFKLGMKNASFKLNLEVLNDFNEFGKDKLELLFSSNMGSDYKKIRKTVSGGELSRIMLSIKYLTSKFHNLPTIIFDEIDAGVSGSVANQIGMLMKDMSKSTQVFAITHIPQVAARGNNHIKVFKQTNNSDTITNLKDLNRTEREDEIALMLSGKKLTISALEHARELLD